MKRTDSDDDDGSNELLLCDGKELLLCDGKGVEDEGRIRADLQEAEESIQLLIDALEEHESSTSGEDRKTSIKERGRAVGDSSSKPSVSYVDYETNDNVNQSAMGSAVDLKLIISENVTFSDKFGSSSKGPTSVNVMTREKLALKLLKKHRSETGKVICGVVISLVMLGLGGGLIALAWLLSMKDLFLLGGMFLLGGIIFTIVFIVVRCKAKDDNAETDYSVLYKT